MIRQLCIIRFPHIFLSTEDGKIVLAEEVTDCGPLVDLDKSPGCQLVPEETNAEAAFPDCCPVYDCEEGAEVVYVAAPAKEEKPRTSS